MKLRGRVVASLAAAAAVLLLGALGFTAWHTHRILEQSAISIKAEKSFGINVRQLQVTPDTRFDWFATPAIFNSGVVFNEHLYLCGPAGLYVYSATGEDESWYADGVHSTKGPGDLRMVLILRRLFRPRTFATTGSSRTLPR